MEVKNKNKDGSVVNLGTSGEYGNAYTDVNLAALANALNNKNDIRQAITVGGEASVPVNEHLDINVAGKSSTDPKNRLSEVEAGLAAKIGDASLKGSRLFINENGTPVVIDNIGGDLAVGPAKFIANKTSTTADEGRFKDSTTNVGANINLGNYALEATKSKYANNYNIQDNGLAMKATYANPKGWLGPNGKIIATYENKDSYTSPKYGIYLSKSFKESGRTPAEQLRYIESLK